MKIIIMAIKKDLDRAFFTPFNRAILFQSRGTERLE